jgi:flagellum-specific peptidoglycan hydrolase FlgJ
VNSVRKPTWQRSTALVSLTTCGAMTGFAFAHGSVADLTSPTSMPVHLLAADQAVQQAPTTDSALRSAIVKAASYYLRMARDNSPADMQAVIWQNDSVNGVDHGQSCAAFASLVLEMGSRATGQQSWVAGGGTYPWPLRAWADVRVEPNPNSPGVVSILQDAQAHDRWHQIGDGYTPQAGDWVLFDGHVEVVTKYAGGMLYTIGGDSMPNLSVNAHRYADPLADQGVLGFVNNGVLVSTASQTVAGTDGAQAALGHSAIPGLLPVVLGPAGAPPQQAAAPAQQASTRGAQAPEFGAAVIPGLEDLAGAVAAGPPDQSSPAYVRSNQPTTHVPDVPSQQAFISQVAPGAVAAQRTYGIPAAVTIAQAIDESGWGQSELATQDHNLFGIKGSGPAGSVQRPTEEYQNGSWVATTASFRVYHSVAESIADHSRLLASGESYRQAMANRQAPDAFANHLTGVYATDPNYGANLITIMRLYNLYRYDPTPAAAPTVTPTAPQVTNQVTTQVAAADHGANVPGLEQPALAFGGSGQLGAVLSRPAHSVPRPRGTVTAGNALGRGAHDEGERGGASRTNTTRTTTARGDRSRGTTAQSGLALSESGQGRSSTGTADWDGTVHAGTGRAGGPGGSARDGSTRSGGGRAGSPQGGNVRGGGGLGTSSGQARIPGLIPEYPATAVGSASAGSDAGHAAPVAAGASALGLAGLRVRRRTKRYAAQIPSVVTTDFNTMAKHPIARAKPLYQDVARRNNVPWQVLAACDWMQCKGEPRYSPVRGERLGTKNPDGTRYRTKSEALDQCAADLIALADAVYGVDLTAPLFLSVLELAQVFAAFRWGGLLKEHRVSAMEFPYSVEGLTVQHLDLRWPDIREPNAPDKPGARFRMPFGAVPIVLSLDYPAVA